MTFRFTIPACVEVGELKLNYGDSLLRWECADHSWSLELGRKYPLLFKVRKNSFEKVIAY